MPLPHRRYASRILFLAVFANAAASAADAQLPADAIVRASFRNAPRLDGLVAEASMTVINRPRHFSLTAAVEIAVRRPADLRIRASKLLGQMEVFDVVMRGQALACYVPKKRTVYHGRVADLEAASFHFRPDTIANHLLGPDDTLLEKTWRLGGTTDLAGPDADRFDDEPGELVRVLRLDDTTDRWRLYVEPDTYRLRRIERLDDGGTPELAVDYGRYRPVETHSGARIPYPFRLAIAWPRRERSVELRFRDVLAEAPRDDSFFAVSVPRGTRKKALRDVRLDSDAPAGSRP